MRRVVVSEPDEGVLSPAPRLSGELIVHEVDITCGEPESLHVQVELGLDDVVGIEAAHHDDDVIAASLGIDQRIGMRGVVKMQVAQLLQRRVLLADVVQPAEQHVEVFAALFGGLPISGPILEFLRVQVLLAALAERSVSNSSKPE